MSHQMDYPNVEAIMRSGHFDLVEKVGEGGSGVVWRAVDRRTGREVALKFLKLMSSGPGWLAGDCGLTRFEREIELLARLEHPGLVRLYESHLDQDPLYFAMEWVDGDDLLTSCKEAPLDEQVERVWQGAIAIAYAHRRGVLHRDLKPSNILVSESGEIKVVDFGLGRAFMDESLTQSPVSAPQFSKVGEAAGTRGYAPPEQVLGRWTEVDTRSDVFSLGVVLYQLVAGELPYDMATSPKGAEDQVNPWGSVPDPRKVNAGVSKDLAAVITKAIRPSLEERYSSMDEFAEDLARCAAGEPVEARAHVEKLYRVGKHLRRYAVLYTVGLLGLASLGSLAVAGYVQEKRAGIRERGLREEADVAKRQAEESRGRAEDSLKEAQLARDRAKKEAVSARQQALLARARNLLDSERLQEAWKLLAQAFENGATPPWEIGYLMREIEVLAKRKAVHFYSLDHSAPVRLVQFLEDSDQTQFAVFDRDECLTIYQVNQLAHSREVVEVRRTTLPEGRWFWLASSAAGHLFGSVEGKKGDQTTNCILLDKALAKVAEFSLLGFVDAGAIDSEAGRIGVLSDDNCFQLRNLADGELIANHPWPHKYSHFSNWRVDFQGERVFVKGGTWEQASFAYRTSDGEQVGKFKHRIQNHYAMQDGSSIGMWSRENGGGSARIVRYDDLLVGRDTDHLDLDSLHLGLGRIDFSSERSEGSLQRFTFWQRDTINRVVVDWESGRSRVEALIPDAMEPWSGKHLRALGFSEQHDLAILAEDKKTEGLRLYDLSDLALSPHDENDHHWKAPTEQWAVTATTDEVLTITTGDPAFGSFPGRVRGERASNLEARGPDGKVMRRWKLQWPESLGRNPELGVVLSCGIALSPKDESTLAVVFHEAPSASVNENWGFSYIATYKLDEGDAKTPAMLAPLTYFPVSDRKIRAHKWNQIAFSPSGTRLACEFSTGRVHVFEVGSGKLLKEMGGGRVFTPSPSGKYWVSGSFEKPSPVVLINVEEGTEHTLFKGVYNGAAFGEGELTVLVGDGKKEIRKYAVTSLELLRTLPCKLIPKTMIPSTNRLIAFKSDRGTLGSVVLADVSNGELITTLDPSAHIAVKARVIGRERTVILSNSRRAISGFQSVVPKSP
jgi:hypothetical protein